ncbi:hypothetical protein EVJ58_g3646 [Rhodofomes roseus]|uniref:DUF3533 domain-containing protein n=1 Tax=Rhodofomes roseus TaxID=34475 RepID=A0A4Y9YL02_9APHY|nr:hypothetical protein EVJ58_g3646 [Rhodofomes roseus]
MSTTDVPFMVKLNGPADSELELSDLSPAASSHMVPAIYSSLGATAEKPRRHPLFHPNIAQQRKQYFTFYYAYATLLILLMWILLPIYWASLAYTDRHTQRLTVLVTDLDQSLIGEGILAAVQRAQDQAADVTTLGWQIVNSTASDNSVVASAIDAVVDEQIWAAVVVHSNATSSVLSSFASGTSGPPAGAAVDVYYNEARNEFAANFYIVPILTAVLTPALAGANANVSAQFVSANAGNRTALANFVAASSASDTRAVATAAYNNLRPFSAPVVSALTEVGMILIVIFSFILTMANSALRPIVARHLTLPWYVALRVCAPLLAYVPLSLSFAVVSLPFHVPFDGKYTEAQGFFLFWILCYMLMCGFGLATEFAIGVLTIKFAPFFLLTLIISNVSVTEFPLELLPGVFRYGRGFPFYNASQAFRTITFDAKSHLGVNVAVLICWVLISLLTVSASTWIIEGRNRRRGIEEEAHH